MCSAFDGFVMLNCDLHCLVDVAVKYIVSALKLLKTSCHTLTHLKDSSHTLSSYTQLIVLVYV